MKAPSEVGETLDGLAGRAEYARIAGSLRRLADDLRSGEVGVWSRLDVFDVFDIETAARPGPTSVRLLAQLELVRNFLLLLPVLITWAGIFLAVRAYRELLSVPAEAARYGEASFLQLWTIGFGGRTWATLDTVALLDAIAILLVIVVAIGGGVLRRQADTEEERVHDERYTELHGALAEAAFVIAELAHRGEVAAAAAGPEDVTHRYREAADVLLGAQKELTSSLSAWRDQLGELSTTTQALTAAGATAAGSASELGTQVGRLDTAVGSLVDGMRGIGTDIPTLSRGLGEVVGGLAGVDARLRELTRGQEGLAERLSVIAERPKAAAETAARTADLARETQQALTGAVAALPAQLDGLRAEVVAAVDRQLDTRATALSDLSASSTAAQDAAVAARDAVNALVGGLGEVRSMPADVAAAAATGFRTQVDGLGAEITRLESRLSELVDGTRGLGDRVPGVERGLQDVLAGLRDLENGFAGIHGRQDAILQALTTLTENPLTTARSAERAAELAHSTGAALTGTIAALPERLDALRTRLAESVTAELGARESALASLTETTQAALNAARAAQQGVEQLIRGLGSVTQLPPDITAAAAQIALNLDRSRELLERLDDGGRRRGWRMLMGGVGRG